MSGCGRSSVSGRVWEWQRDDGGFSPFPPQDIAAINTAFNSGSTTCSTVSGYTLDFSRMMQIRTTSRHDRSIRKSTLSLPASPKITAYWTWNQKGTSFVPYSMDAMIDIELAYQKSAMPLHGVSTRTGTRASKCSSVDLSKCSSKLPYTIDFSAMEQTRHGYDTKRKIRRELIPGGQSLQNLLQISTPSSATTRGKSSQKIGTSSCGFSLASGPATSMLQFGASGGGTTSLTPSLGPVTVDLTSSSVTGSGGGGGGGGLAGTSSSGTSHQKPAARKGRGKKSKSSASPPLGRGGDGSEIPEYATLERILKPEDDGPCPICMCELSEQSGYVEDSPPVVRLPYAPPVDLCKLRSCGHRMHRPCLLMMMKSESAKNGLTCPTCKKVYGIKTGDMPNGTMDVRHSSHSLPGHEGYGCIEIIYSFSPGVHNGHRYRANGFPRTCYLPDSPKGQKVLKMLKVAWDRRLTFTIGTSVTTGAADTVVWNEIHHKTESTSNHSGHGYPDPNYLDNVLMELALQGVEDSDTASLSSSSDDSL